MKRIALFIILMALVCTLTYAQDTPLSITAIDWSPDGQTLAVGYGSSPCDLSTETYAIELINVSNDSIVKLKRHICSVSGLDFNSTGTKLASQGGSFTILWDIATGTPDIVIDRMTSVNEIEWSPDDSKLLTVREQIIVSAIPSANLPVGSGTTGLMVSDGTLITDAVWGVDSVSVAYSRTDGTVHIWNSATEKIQRVFDGHDGVSVESVAWNPIGDVIASGDVNGIIKLWSPTTGREITTLTGHTGAINSLAWSPDGRGLVSASSDGSVRVWQMGTYTTAATFEYGAPVYAVDWNNDSTKIVYGGEGIAGERGKIAFQTIPALVATSPIADAGLDQTTAGDGFSAQVQLDGTGSFDSDGTITNYTWTEGGQTFATGMNPLVSLGVGTHTLTLTVTDKDGGTDTDEVVITVLSQTATPTLTPSLTPSITPTPSQTPTASATYTASPYPTWTDTPNR